MTPTVQTIATANPPLYVTQEEAFEHYRTLFDLSRREESFYQRLLIDGPVRGRYIGMDSADQAAEQEQDQLIGRFEKYGRQTAAEAARKALKQSGYRAEDLGGLVVNTCTGYLCPGLSSYLAEDLLLPSNIDYLDLMGMGCGGALPNWQAATGLLLQKPEKPIMSLSVEICTATLFMGKQADLIISNAIFGDGAAASILHLNPTSPSQFQILGFESLLDPQHREKLRYRSKNGRLRNTLSNKVPQLAADASLAVTQQLLKRFGLEKEEISFWAVHPGGTTVLEAVGESLELSHHDLRFSYEVFEQYGNMSSPSVLFALKRLIEEEQPAPGSKGIALGFGAGFSAFAALLAF